MSDCILAPMTTTPKTDAEMLDWLERTLSNGGPTEVFFAGLRKSPDSPATSYQCEIQPSGMWPTPYLGESLREAIAAAMQRPAPHRVRPHTVGGPAAGV